MDTAGYRSNEMEEEIDLSQIAMILWHKAWIIALAALLAGAVGFLVSRFALTPMYESTTKVYILNKKDGNSSLTYSDLQLGSQLTKDYAELIKSRNVLEKVIENLGLVESPEELAARIRVSTPSDTRILGIVVSDPSPEWAQTTADEIRNVASTHITQVMDIEAVNVVDTANLPERPSEPSVKKWTAVAALLGAGLAMSIIVIGFLLDDTVKTSEDVEKHLGLSTLALIPLKDAGEAQKEKNRQERIMRGMEQVRPKEEEQIEE